MKNIIGFLFLILTSSSLIAQCTTAPGSETYTGCSGDGYSVDVNGTTYDEANPFGTEIFTNANNCDSTVTISLTFNNPTSETETYTGCSGDGYSVDVNGTTYDEANPSGTEIFTNANNCDSTVTISLTFNNPTSETETYTGCSGDGYSVDVNGTTYDEANPSGTEIFTNANNCDSTVTISLTFNNPTSGTETYTGCSGDGYSVDVNSTTYDEANPSGTEIFTNANNCDSTVTISLTFNNPTSGTETYTGCSGDGYSVDVNGTTYDEANPSGTEIFTNANNCDSTVTISLTFNNPTSGTETYTGCSGDGYSVDVNGTTYDEANPSGTEIFTNANICDSTVTISLTFNNPTSGTETYTGCSGDGYSVDVNGTTYDEANPSGTEIFTNANNCDSTVTILLTFNNSPISNVGSNQTINCIDNVNGVSIGSSSQSGIVYQWSPSDGLSNINSSNPIANPLETTQYTLTTTNSFGCSSTDEVLVEVNTEYPTANAGTGGIITCIENINGITIGSPTITGLNYQWQPSLGLSQPNESTTNAFPVASTYYQLQVTNPINGCTTTDSVFIEIDNNLPNFSAGSDQNTCVGTFIVLEGTGASTYSWDNGIQNGIPFLPNNSQYYTLTGTGSNGCIGIDSVYVSINPAPIVNAGTDTTICSGTSIILAGEGASAYDWSSGVINGIEFVPQNSNTYILTGYSEFGCSQTDQVTVNVIDSPEINFENDASVCFGDNIELFISEDYEVLWSGMHNSNENLISFSPNESGFLYLYAENELDCSKYDSTYIIVNAIPYPTINGPDFACENSQWQNYQSIPTLNYTEWTVENGEINWAFAANDVFVQWDSGTGEPIIGTISITETITETNCSNSYSKTVTLNGVAPESATIEQLFEGSSTLYTQNDYPIMNWGYESVDTHIPVYIDEHNQYCEFENFDPSNYNYWVEIGVDETCLTKSYFNQPGNVLLADNEEIGYYYLYPNPAQDNIHLKSDTNSDFQYEIINLNGAISAKGKIQKENPSVSIENLEKGIYYINLIQDNGQQATLKFIKI